MDLYAVQSAVTLQLLDNAFSELLKKMAYLKTYGTVGDLIQMAWCLYWERTNILLMFEQEIDVVN
ncbi:MAG: hypothetical protein R2766_09585 [Saprospiraceae bacterium]